MAPVPQLCHRYRHLGFSAIFLPQCLTWHRCHNIGTGAIMPAPVRAIGRQMSEMYISYRHKRNSFSQRARIYRLSPGVISNLSKQWPNPVYHWLNFFYFYYFLVQIFDNNLSKQWPTPKTS